MTDRDRQAPDPDADQVLLRAAEVSKLRQHVVTLQDERASLECQVCALREDREDLQERAWMLQRLVDAHVQASKPARVRAGFEPFDAKTIIGSAQFPDTVKAKAAAWAAEFQAGIFGSAEVQIAVCKTTVGRMVSMYQELDQDVACPEDQLLFCTHWRLVTEVLRHTGRTYPGAANAIAYSLRKDTAATPRRALISAHFQALTGAKLQRVQAEFIALAAQDFQAGLKQLQQQHADCLVALQQEHDRQALLGPGCNTAGLAAVVDRLQQLQSSREQQRAQLVHTVLGPRSLQGMEGASLVVKLAPMCLELPLLAHIILDQVNRHCTVSLLRQAQQCQAREAPAAGAESPDEDHAPAPHDAAAGVAAQSMLAPASAQACSSQPALQPHSQPQAVQVPSTAVRGHEAGRSSAASELGGDEQSLFRPVPRRPTQQQGPGSEHSQTGL